jgi:hypothetical protein
VGEGQYPGDRRATLGNQIISAMTKRSLDHPLPS